MTSRLLSLKKIIENEVGHKLHTSCRKRQHTYARAIYYKVAREMGGPRPYSLTEIGDVINRDHATVRHGLLVAFPFAMKEHPYRILYLTMKAMFVDENGGDEESYDDASTLRDRVFDLEKQNASLKQKLDLFSCYLYIYCSWRCT